MYKTKLIFNFSAQSLSMASRLIDQGPSPLQTDKGISSHFRIVFLFKFSASFRGIKLQPLNFKIEWGIPFSSSRQE
jgi:hypothetical protein